MKRLQSSEPLHTTSVWAQHAIFSAKPGSKNAGESAVVLLRMAYRIFEEFKYPTIQTEIEQHFGGIFHQIKVRQPTGRKDSIQTMCRRSRTHCRRLEAFLYEAAQNFEVF
jgi:hypothetical protein